MPYATARDGTRLHFNDWGAGPAAILIHGWPLSGAMWEYQATALVEAGMRVITYDRRGFGKSDQPRAGYDYDTFADDLGAIIEASGVDRAALIGFSMGGGEVARYLSRHGAARVTRAALIGAVTPFMLRTDDNPDGVPDEALEEIKDNIRKDRPHFLAGFGKDFYGVGWVTQPVSDEWLAWTQALALAASPIATLACVDAFGRTDFRADMEAFTVPTLIIHGTGDKTVPIDATARAAAQLVPHADLVEYSGAPHGLFATEPARLSEDLIRFLR